MLAQNTFNGSCIQIAFPYSRDYEAAASKISVLAGVAFLLSYLTRGKRLKSRMSMPVISVCLNNQIVDANINDKLWLYDRVRFKWHGEIIQNAMETLFKFGWFFLLQFAMSLKQARISFWVRLVPGSYFFLTGWSFHGIVSKHIFLRLRMNQTMSCFFVHRQAEVICFVNDGLHGALQIIRNRMAPFVRIMSFEIINFRISPELCDVRYTITGKFIRCSRLLTRKAQWTFSFISVSAATFAWRVTCATCFFCQRLSSTGITHTWFSSSLDDRKFTAANNAVLHQSNATFCHRRIVHQIKKSVNAQTWNPLLVEANA